MHPPRRFAPLSAALISAALAVTTFASGPAVVGPNEDPKPLAGEVLAREFTEDFLAARFDELQPVMTADMKAAFGESQARVVLVSLEGANGSVRDVGEAWPEDEPGGYRRFRVPVTFEKSTLDFRVVLEGDLVAGFFFVAHTDPPTSEDSVAPVREIELQVGDGPEALGGTLSVPDGSGPFPGVVLVHGSGPNDRDETIGPNKPFRDIAWGLAKRGVAVLRYDKRTRANPESLAGVADSLTVEHEVVADARVALAVLRDAERIDPGEVYVLGHSLGGMVAPRVASTQPRPAGIVILAGATRPLPEKMLEQYRYIAGADGFVNPMEKMKIDEIESAVTKIRKALDGDAPPPEGNLLGAPFSYYRDLDGYDPGATARDMGVPVLVLQGRRDYQVTLEDFAGWEKPLSGKPFACLHLYDGLNHLFQDGEGASIPSEYDEKNHVSEPMLDDVATWILTRECPGS